LVKQEPFLLKKLSDAPLRGLPWTNTVAYYKNLQLTVVKSFITSALILMNKNAIFNSAERLNLETIIMSFKKYSF
jgi:hypothetical protein